VKREALRKIYEIRNTSDERRNAWTERTYA